MKPEVLDHDSEVLAGKLRSLYELYGSVEKLPPDLDSKLRQLEPEACEIIQAELNRDGMYPLSRQEALEEIKVPVLDKLILVSLFASFGALGYASKKDEEEEDDKNQKREVNLPKYCLSLVYGGLKTLPSAVKEVFLVPREELAQEFMESHNQEARIFFEGFKNNLEYFLRREK